MFPHPCFPFLDTFSDLMLRFWSFILILSPTAVGMEEIESRPEEINYFERRLRPLLAEHCYSCHSAEAETMRGGLRLDSRSLLMRGDDGGSAIDHKDPNNSLPDYVVLCPGRPVRFPILWKSAFMPSANQGTYINHSAADAQKMVPHLKNQQWDSAVQREQLNLLPKINAVHQATRPDEAGLAARTHAIETACRMQFQASEAFDLKRETSGTHKSHGDSHFANDCLLARRLVERGVRFVQVYYGNGQPWDTHSNHNTQLPKLGRAIDQPVPALLSDLKLHGLMEYTLVVWGDEFGRTPTSENSTGRDHHVFTMWMSGGGIKGGMTYGETDDFGFRAVRDKVHVHDLHATMLHLPGMDHERLTYRHAGRDFRLTDVYDRVIQKILA